MFGRDYLREPFYIKDYAMLTDKELRLGNIQGITDVFNKRVYKYVPFEDAVNYILIEKNTLKFTDPDDFNDPFDCYEGFVNFSNLPSDDVFDKLAKRLSHPSVAKETAVRTKKFFKDKKKIATFYKTEKNKHRVCCFSKAYDEVLMWSHYANKHRGICIGFEFPIEPRPKDFVILPVVYKDKVFPFDAFANPFRIILHWLVTKSHHWKYEREVRAIIKKDSVILSEKGIYNIEKEWIKEIIFGCKVSYKDIEKTVRQVRKAGYKNILIKKMSIDTETFSLKETIVADIQNYRNKNRMI